SGDGSLPTANYVGYPFFSNFGVTWGSTIQLLKRTAFGNNDPLNQSGDSTVLTSGGTVTGTTAFSNNVPYALTFSLARTNNTTVLLTATYSGGGLTNSLTATDTSGIYTNFDMFEIRPSGSASTATNFIFTEFKVVYTQAGSPPFINSQPQDLSVFTNQSAA